MAATLLLIALDNISSAQRPVLGGAFVPLCTLAPSAVFPTYASLVTGQYPERHGVVSDAPCSVGVVEPMPHQSSGAIRAKTIFAVAKAAGMTTAAVAWPLTGDCADLDVVEPDTHDDLSAIASAERILHDTALDLLCLRLHGDSSELSAALEKLVCFAENTVLVSGVCWRAVEAQMQLNAAFAARGLISLNPDGTFADYKAWSQSNGLSSLVYLKNPSNMGVHEETETLLNELKERGDCGIGRIITREEAATRYRLYGSFSFVVCSDGKTVFGNGWQNENLVPTAQMACGQISEEASGWMMAIGPRFTNAKVETAYAIPDVAATCAKLLNLRLPMSKGKPIAEILAE